MSKVPEIRVRCGNAYPIRESGRYVLYWMTANRRPHWNYSLDHAINWARRLKKPLLVFEALRCGYEWASDRIHRFVIQGMAANARRFDAAGVRYYPYLEAKPGDDKGLLYALAEKACLVVADDFPAFFVPRMLAAQQGRMPALLELVDSNGLLPMHLPGKDFPTAYAFRRTLQKMLPDHLLDHPQPKPLASPEGLTGAVVPADILRRWPAATAAMLEADPATLANFSIDHSVGPAIMEGGFEAGDAVTKSFLKNRLKDYGDSRNHPDEDASSGLSPYLHFGHVSSHDVFHSLAQQEKWDITDLASNSKGTREGWWGMSPAAESFLDEIITWREVGYNKCVICPDTYDKYESLPDWALKTLTEHAGDTRDKIYSLSQFESAATHDPVWNAAQKQLVREGRMHNYMRMLWGKKILEWSATPREALSTMIHLNNKYEVDGRDPNSYSGIFWVLGRYDRPWPRRPVYGVLRYMSSDNTLKKLRMRSYMKQFA